MMYKIIGATSSVFKVLSFLKQLQSNKAAKKCPEVTLKKCD